MLSDLYPPYIGGLERHVRNLALALVARGHQVSVATMRSRDRPPHSADEGLSIHRLGGTTQRAGRVINPSGRPYLPPIPDPEVAWALNRIVRAEAPDIVHAHNWMLHSVLPVRRRRAKLVVTLHDYGLVCAKRSLIYRGSVCSGPELAKCLRCAADHYGTGKGLLIGLGTRSMDRVVRTAVDMFLPVSEAVALGNGLDRDATPYRVVPNFVPDAVADEADPLHPALSALPDRPFLLFVGAITREKGIDVLLDAYRRLNHRPPLVIIGTRWPGSPMELPPDVVLLEDLPHPAVMAAWKRSLAALVPSTFPDPCPTVVMEAMAAGVPVIASRIGGIPDIVCDGETGTLVTPGDPVSLVSAIQSVVDDAAMRGRMGAAGRIRVQQFMASAVVDRLERVYGEVTGQTPVTSAQ